MKKIFNYALVLASAMTLSMSFVSCSSNDDNGSSEKVDETAKLMADINAQFVDGTVVPTYKGLADACINLEKYVNYIETQKSDASVAAACKRWKEARQYWEWSEAFLFGAAHDYSIDPHIDTWPLDKAALTNLLNSLPEDVAGYVANLNSGLVGFHGIEYILFREGNERKYADIMEENGGKELEYAKAVAADLTYSACRLERAWAGEDALTAEKKQILEDGECDDEDNFGEEMKTAGQAGSRYKTVKIAMTNILKGCDDILGEVADSKIGAPYNGASEEDINYIESPHAYNSIQDFYDNTVSCKNALYGKLGATTAETNSVMAYAKTYFPTQAAKIESTMEAALTAVNSMKKPFVLNRTDSSAKAAIDALKAFDDAVNDLREKILEQ